MFSERQNNGTISYYTLYNNILFVNTAYIKYILVNNCNNSTIFPPKLDYLHFDNVRQILKRNVLPVYCQYFRYKINNSSISAFRCEYFPYSDNNILVMLVLNYKYFLYKASFKPIFVF